MNEKEFVIWLRGFMAAEPIATEDTLEKIGEMLDEVQPETYTIYGSWTQPNTTPDPSECHCHPSNGGSGVCGCVLFSPTIT